jgi:hypothetical protein
MPFLDSLDVANRALFHVGQDPIESVSEDSKKNTLTAFAYDKLRRPELRRNTWRFSIRRVILRAIDTTTMILDPDEWDTEVTYSVGSIVKDENGVLWVSRVAANLASDPATTSAWDQYFGPMTVSLYDSTLTYSAGELVYKAGTNAGSFVIYMSREGGNDDVPSTATAYVATTTYNKDDVVSSGGFNWRSLIEFNIGTTPAVAATDWDETAIYAASDAVTGSDGYKYTSVAGSNTGNDPVGNLGVHWTATNIASAWAKTPTIQTSATTWLPLFAAMTSINHFYPIGSGPSSQAITRNAYRLPAGFLRMAAQDPKAGSYSPLGAGGGNWYRDWDLEGNFFVSSEPGPVMARFVADVVDVQAMDDMFIEGLACRIAMAVCEPITQSVTKLSKIEGQYKVFMGEARTVNAIEIGAEEPPEDDYLTARY